MLGPAVRCCDTFTSRASGFHPSAALLVTYWTALGEELVSRLLHAHFKDDKTKVSGDSLQLMAELLKIFVVGEPRAQAPSQKQPSVRYGRPRQKMPFLWMWTSWRRCFRSCSWTSRDLSRG
ncbi:centromere protein X isoform X10 [Callithrix jacchus]|uniref:centromere protein X isoform X4 n=1 Tax=Callithrix jacchus TaxID=9483 RepID=UPI00159E25BA|nr:centromere protein X isoform X4 [Callithrix jacchus]